MSDTTTATVADKIAAALTVRAMKQPYDPSSNPVGDRSVVDLMHGHGILSSADQYPALDLTAKGGMGYTMEVVRKAGLEHGRKDKSAKRMAQARARAERKAQFDAIAASPMKPPAERLAAAWEVVLPLEPIVTKGAQAKRAWASRFLGSNADDIPQMTLESIVLVLAKSDQDLDILKVAAQELGAQLSSTGKMPGEQHNEEDKKERKKIGKARKWLMGLVNNRLMGALVDSYTSQRNLRWENIDVISTVMANIGGPDDDPYINRHKADRAPAFLGTRFQRPEGIDGNLLAQSITGAITSHGLDALAELLLDPDSVRTDGAFSWSEYAEWVFMLSPQGGEEVWKLVCQATEHLANPRRARADAARTHVRNLFSWLPGVVMGTVDAFDFQAIGYVVFAKRRHAVMESEFQRRLGEQGPRTFTPALAYGSPREAAEALAQHLAVLSSGEDLVSSMVFA